MGRLAALRAMVCGGVGVCDGGDDGGREHE